MSGQSGRAAVYLEEELVRAASEVAAQQGRDAGDIVEDALRQYLDREATRVAARQRLREFLARPSEGPPLTDEEAMQLAIEEQRAYRMERRAKHQV